MLGTHRAVSIDIGEGAALESGDIYIIAQAQDSNLADVVGVPKEVGNWLIGPYLGALEEVAAIPAKLLIKNSSADITIRQGATLTTSGLVGIYATAEANASGSAVGSLISVGFGQATETPSGTS